MSMVPSILKSEKGGKFQTESLVYSETLFFKIKEGERTLKRETKEIMMVNPDNLIRLTNLWGLVKYLTEYLRGCII